MTMTVHGYQVPLSVIADTQAWMRERNAFSAGELEHHLMAQGVPAYVGTGTTPQTWGRKPVAHRVADRLIQNARKAGQITFANRVWSWTGPKP